VEIDEIWNFHGIHHQGAGTSAETRFRESGIYREIWEMQHDATINYDFVQFIVSYILDMSTWLEFIQKPEEWNLPRGLSTKLQGIGNTGKY